MTALMTACTKMNEARLPDYVVCNPVKTKDVPSMLRTPAAPVLIPFSEQDRQDIDTLSSKFDTEENCYGLAAVQIGIPKRIIVFSAKADPETKIWRTDLTDTMQKTVWINPKFTGVEETGYHEDYEGCFSVKGVAGLVKRYKKIKYEAYTLDGVLVTGTAEGFLARLIQHEIDHLDVVLFTDIAKEIIPIVEYRQMRDAAVARDIARKIKLCLLQHLKPFYSIGIIHWLILGH
ncbi:MAG: peptide deformylase [Alphaproteobacteria bacterium]|nr:peptide deformylase [Alphaproteobacteria bacterium]